MEQTCPRMNGHLHTRVTPPPQQANFPYISVKDMANCFREKQKIGWAARMTLLTGPTLTSYKPFGLPCQVNSVKARQS